MKYKKRGHGTSGEDVLNIMQITGGFERNGMNRRRYGRLKLSVGAGSNKGAAGAHFVTSNYNSDLQTTLSGLLSTSPC